jgi:glycogen operon protein
MIHPQRRFGATVTTQGVDFVVWSGSAERIWLCLFEGGTGRETARHEMVREDGGCFSLFVAGLGQGARYAYRADGHYAPERGLWFDPCKLLADPYAIEIESPYRYDALMAAERQHEVDAAAAMPKAIVVSPEPVPDLAPIFRPGGLVYEINVRAFTKLHPGIPEEERGTVAALAHPVVIDHLRKLGVTAVELMPVTAWIDERHLPPLGLRNAWGYNPVTFMALDPRLAPGGIAELRRTVMALHSAGIGTILDLVFNHTGESDAFGPTLSLRGFDALSYFAHQDDGTLVNDTGTGNTVNCDQPVVQRMVLDTLRHFVRYAGVDGFRFDLATVLGRTPSGFRRDARLLEAISTDPLLAGRTIIAEPWDIGPGGYQLGNFPHPFLEWNDRYRDDVRRFWRGDHGTLGSLATRLAGSSDIFGHTGHATRTVNFVAAHDGMTLADICAYAYKNNEANGEDNRDGHDENFSWNNGVEGESADPDVRERRARDIRAMLTTLFMSRGTIMLTAGDEFGRTQRGNNNAYAQDNELTWLDWERRDRLLEELAFSLAGLRKTLPMLHRTHFLQGEIEAGRADVLWLDENGDAMQPGHWNDPARRRLVMLLDGGDGAGRLAIMINGETEGVSFSLPLRQNFTWKMLLPVGLRYEAMTLDVDGRTVAVAIEEAASGEGP